MDAKAGEVRIDNLRKAYGQTVAVDDVSLTVPSGSFFCLLGPSGCGKTTLLRMIAGLVPPDGGTVTIDGRDMGPLPANKRPTSIVFQDYALFPHMSVFRNAEYGLVAGRRGDKKSRADAVAKTLELLGLTDLADRYPRQLSGGQQQRVALARSLVIEPDVLLMDEPLSNLDAKMRVALRTSLRELQQSLGITTIYVTHDQEEALAMADNIAVMHEGAVVQYGSPLDIYDSPVSVDVADFIGTTNVLPGSCIRTTDETIELDVLGDSIIADTSRQRFVPERGETVQVCIRPNAMRVDSAVERKDSTLRATVKDSQFVGDSVEYVLEKQGHQLIYFHDDPYAPRLAGDVNFAIESRRVRVLPTSAASSVATDEVVEVGGAP